MILGVVIPSSLYIYTHIFDICWQDYCEQKLCSGTIFTFYVTNNVYREIFRPTTPGYCILNLEEVLILKHVLQVHGIVKKAGTLGKNKAIL